VRLVGETLLAFLLEPLQDLVDGGANLASISVTYRWGNAGRNLKA